MPRRESPTLTEAEMRLMDIVWAKRQATVQEVVDALPPEHPLAYSTVLTTLRILEQKGYLRHCKESRAFVYYPVVERDEARRTALREVVHRFFDGSPELLVLKLLEDDQLDAAEIARLKRMVAESEQGSGS